MLQSIKQLKNLVLLAEDGEIGRSKDFLIDDRAWVIRYMVVDTGKWLATRKVLVVPEVLERPDWQTNQIPLQMSKQQIEQAPGLDTDAPVSRQYEAEYFRFFDLPFYWNDSAPSAADTGAAEGHLRSTGEVIGYSLQATDEVVGQVDDFLVDDEDWMVRYLIVDIGNWLKGRKVLVAPAWLGEVDWAEGSVSVHMTREQLGKSPPYEEELPVGRDYEEKLHEHYKLPKYWDGR